MAFSLSMLTGGSGSLVGVDVSSFAVKMVELATAGNGTRVERYAIEMLPRGAVSEGGISNMDDVVKTVGRC